MARLASDTGVGSEAALGRLYKVHSRSGWSGRGTSGAALAGIRAVNARHLRQLTLAAAAAAAVACGRHEPGAEERVLRLEVEKLRAQVADAEAGTLLDFHELLVVVDQKLVQQLLTSAIPIDGDV